METSADQPLWAQSHICILHLDEGGAFTSVTKQCLQKSKRDKHLVEVQHFLPAMDSYLEAVGRRP